MTQERIEEDLAEDRVDIGIAFAPPQLAGIEVHELHAENLEVVVGAGHPAAAGQDGLDPQQLAQLPLVLLSEDFATRQHVDRYFHAHAISPRIAAQTNSVSTLLELVRAGQLVTVLPDRIASQQHALRAVALTPPIPPRTAALLRRAGAHHSAAGISFTTLATSSSGNGPR
jgi:LysR family transcriptional regulator, cyn operon transcriptional activator